jgi:hypothetical protein
LPYTEGKPADVSDSVRKRTDARTSRSVKCELPDRMATRTLFSSIDSLTVAVSELQQAIAAASGDTKPRVAQGLAESAA